MVDASAAMSDPRFDDVSIERLRAAQSVKWREYPADVLPAWIADMDFAMATPIRDAVRGYIDQEFIGYPGLPFSAVVSNAYAQSSQRRYGLSVDPLLVDVVTEVVQGLHAAAAAFTDPGDGVLILTPVYPPFLETVGQQRRRLVEFRVEEVDGVWTIDWDRLRALVSTERPKLFLLCHPHNPLGRAFDRRELQQFFELAEEFDMIVVSDEIHADLVFAPISDVANPNSSAHIPFASIDSRAAARTVTLHSPSKAFNTAGLRCAVIAYGTAELHERSRQRLSMHLLGIPATIGMIAAATAWTQCDEWLAACVSYLEGNAIYVADRFAKMHIPVIANQATYLQWINFSSLPRLSSRLTADASLCVSDILVSEAKVALNRGPTFGGDLQACARLNFGTSRAILTELCDRIAAWVTTERA
jgi:cysteine-S-conjugate beta-lyase